MRRMIISFMLVYYFTGLFVYYAPYKNFVRHRSGGIAFELMSAFDLDGYDWQVGSFFSAHDPKGIWIYGSAGFPDPRDYYGQPVSLHAILGTTIEEKLDELERYTAVAFPDYLASVGWEEGEPVTGREKLTLIGKREELVSPSSTGLLWTDRQGEQRHTRTAEIIFTTEIYNIGDVWLLLHTLAPPDAEAAYTQANDNVKQSLLAKAGQFSRGRVNREILFQGLKKVQAVWPFPYEKGFKINPVTALLSIFLVQWPTQPVKTLLFAPMFYVPYQSLERIAPLYFVFLIAAGAAAVLLFVACRKRLGVKKSR